ncbi:MAG: hypothetical protein IPK19_39470 [Chloroflexi bacterium]|nr:hypothetical protein [Chloroflexota bacterium]
MPVSRSKALQFLSALLLITLFIQPQSLVYAATFTVTNTSNTGDGSLRFAILNANATSGHDIIEFRIPGNAVHTISLTTALPDIVYPVTITGETEEGWTAATAALPANLRVVLNGSAIGGNGLKFAAGSDGSTVRGLVLRQFEDGIRIESSNNVIAGNHIGVSADGLTDGGNTSDGIRVYGANNLIGGLLPADRNVLSGNGDYGLVLIDGSAHTVQGNFIGTDSTGTAAIQNDDGGLLVTFSTEVLICGTASGSRNVISGNYGHGIYVNADRTTIQGNYIGLTVTGMSAVPPGAGGRNNDNGIYVSSTAGFDTLIGGETPARAT